MEPDHDPELDDLDAFVDVVADDQLRLMFLCCHPGAGRRRAGRAHAAAARRSRHPRDRPRLPRARGDARPADRAGQAQAPRQPRALPRAPRRRAARPAARRARDRLPDLHRRAHRHDRRRPHAASTSPREAIRLGRVLVELMPDEPEAVGLLALMLLTEARQPARTAADGSMIRLADQDRTRWDRALIAEGHDARARLPAPQPTRTVPDPGRHRRRARRRRRPPTTPTGPRSSPSTTSSTRCARTRSSRSTGPSPSASSTGRPPASPRSTPLDAAALDGLPAVPRRPRRPPRPRRPARRRRRRLRPRHRAQHQPDRTTLPRATAPGLSQRRRSATSATRAFSRSRRPAWACSRRGSYAELVERSGSELSASRKPNSM